MASTPDIDNPLFGYYVTATPEEIITYCSAVLRKFRTSCVFIIHSSAIFEKDGEEKELHLPILRPVILDPQMPEAIMAEFVENQIWLSAETEFYENMDGSGWNLVPGTARYWFKIHPCQPNNGGNPNSRNVSNYDDDQQEDDDRPRSPIQRYYTNNILYAIVEHYARKAGLTVPRVLDLKRAFLKEYNRNYLHFFTDDDFDIDMDLINLPDWHFEMKLFNIRVFSMRGNVLYAKKFDENNDEFIDMYYNSNNQLSYIVNLWTLFKKKHEYRFCMRCYQWKNQNHSCEQKKIASKKEDVKLPDIPLGRAGIVGYADFESYIVESGHHYISGWACLFINKSNEIYDSHFTNLLENDHLVEGFLEYCMETAKTYAVDDDGHESIECKICNNPMTNDDEMVIGRNFINGNQGSHHKACWMHPKNSMYVFFHNFRGYDSHFIIEEIVKNYKVDMLSATSMEKFNVISVIHPANELIRICFKDTFNFFTCSLAKCVSMVEDWRYTPEPDRASKGIFPYDWFDNFEKLNATSLPPGPWYNKLTSTIVDSRPAEEDWEKYGFDRFSQFHDHYMMTDVYQLADVFEEFRRTCIQEFDTDPVHFQGAPGLTWYLGLCQNIKLFKIIRDPEVYMDIQNGIRGGIAQAMVKYVNVENKPDESMFFLDVNSLYSKCMTYKMPGKYLGRSDQLPDNWKDLYNENTEKTAIMVVDLIYPAHLHDRDWAYPLAPHKYNDRLCTTFKRREKYMIHAELLDFYLNRGLILEKFHYLYEFNQDYTLREYVNGNIEKRRHTNSEVMKTLYKLLNNSLYGKTCENVNKYRKFEVIEDQSLLEDDRSPFNSDLADCLNFLMCGDNMLVEKQVNEVILNKPIQIGFTILEFAKREIYRFLAAIQDHFKDQVTPVYTDTDSLLFWCNFDKPWEKFYNSPLQIYLDFEKTPPEWNTPMHDTDKVSGLWSPEAGGKEIVEYCGLRAKCYCYRFRDNSTVIKNKGVPKAAMIGDDDETPRERITMEHYKKALFERQTYKVAQFAIRSFRHKVITQEQYKLGITALDLKRALTFDQAITLPFGYQGERFSDIVADRDDPDNLDP